MEDDGYESPLPVSELVRYSEAVREYNLLSAPSDPDLFAGLSASKEAAVARALVWMLDRTCLSRPLPFHLSGEFMVLPLKWRWEFLQRNRIVCHCFWLLEQARQAIRAINASCAAAGRGPEPWLRAEAEMRRERRILSTPVVGRARAAWGVLIKEFGLCSSNTYVGVIPEWMMPNLGPSDLELFTNLWTGLVEFGFPDVCWERWLRDPSVEQEVFGEIEELIRKHPHAVSWSQLSNRARREVKEALAELRRKLRLSAARQQPDAYYARLLAVWDVREGWTGRGYSPRRAVPLSETLTRASARRDDYYRAFRLVTGVPYSDLTWDFLFGADYLQFLGEEAYQRLRSMPQRRRTGQRRGRRAGAPHIQTVAEPPARSVGGDPATTLEHSEEEAEIKKLLALLSEGVEINLALAQVRLSEGTRLLLEDPANRSRVEAFATRVRQGDSVF
jgi:hypothetical protein